MSIDLDLVMRDQLIERREKVATALSTVGPDPQLTALLRDVDSALARFESGTYGLCERCHDAMESDRVIANPLERFCLGCLTADEQRALEDDLTLASQIQRGLLPCRNLRVGGWHFDYRYEPARVVSGDYVDIIRNGDGDLYFILGDVSGKGVAASMLMAKLHAVFRTLIPLGLRVDQLTERASRQRRIWDVPVDRFCGRMLIACRGRIGHELPGRSFKISPRQSTVRRYQHHGNPEGVAE